MTSTLSEILITKKAALFDLDGVIFDTEPQYTRFWERMGSDTHPDIPDFAHLIKGQTLTQIFDKHYPNQTELQEQIIAELDVFEKNMEFNYLPGFEQFLKDIKQLGLKTAVVTSSNHSKMKSVYTHHPEFTSMFDKIFTAEDFTESKPSPECYLIGARHFGFKPQDCIGFEDSFNGLKSVQSAGMYVVGVASTNSPDAIAHYSNLVIDNFL